MNKAKKRPTVLLFFPRTRHEENYRNYHVPYSLVALAAAIVDLDINVLIFDANVRGRNITDEELGNLGDDLLLAGVSTMMGSQILDALDMSCRVKKLFPNVPVVWGGGLPTLLPEMVVSESTVDLAVVGQGETTLREIISCLMDHASPLNIRGTVYRDHRGQIIFNDHRDFADLDGFPPYEKVYGLINPSDYVWYDEHIAPRTISYHSSQGCPHSCGFCAEVPLWNRKWYGLSAPRVVGDLAFLADHYDVTGIKFYDSEFFVDADRAVAIAKLLIDRSIKIKWGASAHPKRMLRFGYEGLKLFVNSGLKRLLIGVESGVDSERILVGKRVGRNEIFELARLCESLGVYICFTFVTGYPGAPLENINATLDFAHKLWEEYRMHEVKIHFYGPYPKTLLYDKALCSGFTPPQTLQEWAHYDYYKITTPWIHQEYYDLVRDFNERHYPYLHGKTVRTIDGSNSYE